jgi:predicted nucleotidyltransferase
MQELKNLNKLHPHVAKAIRPYMQKFITLHETSIISIFIHGSAASGDYRKGVSDINSGIVFKKMGIDELKKSLSIVSEGIKKGINTPLFFTREHISTSLDTFPIEFMEMKENHIIVYGEDLLSNINIDFSHIRFICEEQIKGKLIRMRQAYLEIGLRKKGIESLIKESFASLFPVFRSLLRLKGIAAGNGKKEDIISLGNAFGIDTGIMLDILADTRNDGKISGRDLESSFFLYLQQLEKLGDIADKLA